MRGACPSGLVSSGPIAGPRAGWRLLGRGPSGWRAGGRESVHPEVSERAPSGGFGCRDGRGRGFHPWRSAEHRVVRLRSFGSAGVRLTSRRECSFSGIRRLLVRRDGSSGARRWLAGFIGARGSPWGSVSFAGSFELRVSRAAFSVQAARLSASLRWCRRVGGSCQGFGSGGSAVCNPGGSTLGWGHGAAAGASAEFPRARCRSADRERARVRRWCLVWCCPRMSGTGLRGACVARRRRDRPIPSCAAVVRWASGLRILRFARRRAFSLRGGPSRFALIGWSWVGSQLAASVVGCLSSVSAAYPSGWVVVAASGGARLRSDIGVRGFRSIDTGW